MTTMTASDERRMMTTFHSVEPAARREARKQDYEYSSSEFFTEFTATYHDRPDGMSIRETVNWVRDIMYLDV